MSHSTRTRGLVVITIIAVVAFVIGFIALKDDSAAYEMTAEEALSVLNNDDNKIGLDAAKKLIASDDHYVLVDLRSFVYFDEGHVEGAINVPFADLLTKASQERFLEDETQHFILYGSSASQASNAWIVLKQVGCQNIQFIPGSYDLLSDTLEEVPLEVATQDYKAVFDEVQKKELEAVTVGKVTKPAPTQPKVVIPVERPKKKRLEGC